MSDEETDTENEGFIIHRVEWRSRPINRLIAKLDECYNSSRAQISKCKTKSARRLGPPSLRTSPRDAPHWAVTKSTNSATSFK